MNKKLKTFLIFTCIIAVYILLMLFAISKSNVNDNAIYKIYMLKENKNRYEKILRDDLIEISINKVEELKSNDQVNMTKEFSFNESNFLLDEKDVINLLSQNMYTMKELTLGEVLSKDLLITYDDIIKNKILEYSFNGYVSYEITNNTDLILKNDTTNSVGVETYNELFSSFNINEDKVVKVYKQDIVSDTITKLIDDAMLIDIDNDKAIICIKSDKSNVLKENLDGYVLIISSREIENLEVNNIEQYTY